MSIKKLLLCFVYCILPALTHAQADLRIFNASDTVYNFTINNKPCETTNSCAISSRSSVLLTEQKLSQICTEQNNMCHFAFGIANRPNTVGTVKYTVRDGIIEVVSPRPCKFCVEETDKHTITLIHRVI